MEIINSLLTGHEMLLVGLLVAAMAGHIARAALVERVDPRRNALAALGLVLAAAVLAASPAIWIAVLLGALLRPELRVR